MKIKMFLVSLLPLMLFTGCSPQLRVRSDYDREINLAAYKTYAWLSVKEIESKANPLIYNELTDKRIKRVVDARLESKGIQYTTDSPGLRVHYHIVIDNKTMVRPATYGYNYSQYWLRNQVDTYAYREGTFIIDLMDAKTNNLVWRGWATDILGNGDLELSEDKINEFVTKILTEFPPIKK